MEQKETDNIQPDLTQLDAIDKKILEMLLSRPGISNQEIGEEVELTRQAVWLRRGNEPLKSIINKLQQTEIDRFVELRRKALEKTEKLIDSSDDKVSVAICKELIKTIVPIHLEHSVGIIFLDSQDKDL